MDKIIKSHNKQLLRQSLIITLLTGVVAVLPLIILFAIPQMKGQGSIGISHFPVFKNNFLSYYVRGIFYSLYWIFSNAISSILSVLVVAVVGMAVLFTIISMLKEKVLRHFSCTLFVAWNLYFVAVACSFYGYNNWDGALGCNNIGGKYALFFAPMIVVALVCGTKCFLDYFKEKSNCIYKVLLLLSVMGGIGFCGVEILRLDINSWFKNDVREVVAAWYENAAFTSETFVHDSDGMMFQYYLRHDSNYDEIYQDNIETAGDWIRKADAAIMEEKLFELGYLSKNEYYYVAHGGSYDIFLGIMKENGFKVVTVYEGETVLFHVTRQ